MEDSAPQQNTLAPTIEAILFFKANPVEVGWLATFLNITEEKVRSELEELRESLSGRGVTLVEKGGSVSLGTSPEMSEVIDELVKKDMSEGVGDAALETLAVILYNEPISRSEIDHIRGVNSQGTLRTLSMRGLVQKTKSGIDGRMSMYSTTQDTLRYLGVSSLAELPEYETIRKEIDDFKRLSEESSGTTNPFKESEDSGSLNNT